MDGEHRGTACDVSEMIPTAELEAERLRLAMLHDYADGDGNAIDSEGHHTYSKRATGRRPKAGHYPINFSPYRMCAVKRGIVPLARGFVKEDLKSMKVALQGFFSCNYFTEDLSCYAPEPADDIFIDELRSTDAKETKNLGSASEKWDSNEDVRRNTACCEENRSEPCGLMIGGCSAPRHQQQKRERVASPVARVNADSDEHILRQNLRKLAEFEMVQGIKIADHEVRRPGGGPPRTLDSSDGDLYDGGKSTEARAPTRANRTEWTVSRLNMRPQNCLQATRKRKTSLVGQQSLMCLMSTQSKAQERRLIKLALAESLREAAAVTITMVSEPASRGRASADAG